MWPLVSVLGGDSSTSTPLGTCLVNGGLGTSIYHQMVLLQQLPLRLGQGFMTSVMITFKVGS
jgi:hypothetical protein